MSALNNMMGAFLAVAVGTVMLEQIAKDLKGSGLIEKTKEQVFLDAIEEMKAP